MNMQVGKWGNNLAVRFPQDMAERLNLKQGDTLDAGRMEALLAELLENESQQRRKAAIEEIRKGRFKLPPDWKFDREEANWRPALDRW